MFIINRMCFQKYLLDFLFNSWNKNKQLLGYCESIWAVGSCKEEGGVNWVEALVGFNT